jgi:acetyl-CoA acyltransferase
MIALGQVETALAGGIELVSDPPLKMQRNTRRWFMKLNKAKGFGQRMGLLSSWRPKMMIPEAQAVSEFSTGETMGQCCEKINAMFKVTREEQDQFSLRSHTLGEKATKEGLLDIVPIDVPGKGRISVDNGIRVAPIEKIRKIKPAYIRPHGTVTAANATFLTDGAAATLLMSESRAKELGLKPKALIKDYIYVGVDPVYHLLMGPAVATYRLLARNNLKVQDIDVFEYHEAFAGQLLCNLKAMDSDWFTQNVVKGDPKQKVGEVPLDKLNTWGGSLSIGHPFGATGSRLVNTAANRLTRNGGKYALIAACAGGGHGHAMIIEKCN